MVIKIDCCLGQVLFPKGLFLPSGGGASVSRGHPSSLLEKSVS